MLVTAVPLTTFTLFTTATVSHSHAVNIVRGDQAPSLGQYVADCIAAASVPIKEAPFYMHVLQQAVYLAIGKRAEEMRDALVTIEASSQHRKIGVYGPG